MLLHKTTRHRNQLRTGGHLRFRGLILGFCTAIGSGRANTYGSDYSSDAPFPRNQIGTDAHLRLGEGNAPDPSALALPPAAKSAPTTPRRSQIEHAHQAASGTKLSVPKTPYSQSATRNNAPIKDLGRQYMMSSPRSQQTEGKLRVLHEQQPRPHNQQQQQQQQQHEEVPNEVAAALTVKIGDAARTSRKQLAVVRFAFLLSDGFDVLRAKANSRTAREMLAASERFVREDPAVYIRPGAHSKQAELVELNASNFESRVARSYRNYLRRKPGTEPFECELVTYVKKDVGGQRFRAAIAAASGVPPTPIPAPTPSVVSYPNAFNASPASSFSIRPSFTYGADNSEASYGEHANGGKRKRSDTPLIVDEGDGYKTVRMIMNGAVVPVRVNVSDLLACFASVGQHQQQAPNGSDMSTRETSSMQTSNTTANEGMLP